MPKKLKSPIIRYFRSVKAQMIREFSYTFQDQEIVLEDIAELLGFSRDEVPDPFPKLIKLALKEAPGLCKIRAGFKLFASVEIDSAQQKIVIEDQAFYPGKTIFSQLKKATSIAIFTGTAGNDISFRSKQLADNGNQLLSYVIDVIGSLVAEKTVNKLTSELEKEFKTSELNISDPYSPGYCNWNISEQEKLFALLPGNFCGITLSESLLMHPLKSVSGFIGIGETLKQEGYQCNRCNDVNCLYGRIKRQKKN